MTLSEKQQQFTRMIGTLIVWAESNGYGLTFGEAYRTPEQARLNAQSGKGIANSLHTQRLAVDFNLFINGQYQADSAVYLAQWERTRNFTTFVYIRKWSFADRLFLPVQN